VERRAKAQGDAGEVEQLPKNVLVKTGSRSLTIEHGKPWSRTMWSKNACATDMAV
jgi:hypothetical protein